MRLAIFLFSLSLSAGIEAQIPRKITISGVVRSQAPIAFADCFLKNNVHLGGLTDTLGYFQFKVPGSVLYDTLVVLAMGFERKEIPLSSLDPDNNTVDIYLDQQSILLQEVLIESDGLNLKRLILQAIANLPNNFPNKEHQLRALYRKVSTYNADHTHLEEAVVLIEDYSYKRPPESIKIKTEHFRETVDWGAIDSLYVTAFDKMDQQTSQRLNTFSNPLHRVYIQNPLRNHNKRNTYFEYRTMRKYIDDHYTFQLMGISVVQGDTICQIAFAESVTPPPPKRTSGRTYVKINMTDLAIVELQFTWGFENQPLMSQQHVQFEKRHGRYYPRYMKSIHPRSINRNFDDNEFDIHIVWFDEVKVKEFKRIKFAEANDPDNRQGHKRPPSPPAFWDNNRLIKKYPLEQGVRADLERRQKLSEQFIATGQH